ncbi:MAG: DUF3017 domain-containing protein [Tessaracoccus sp.]|uniref:DUF3017 domain-containing protein n=1 Tax=Tessaracoccus sp. TaxID=1971211 RepID=UPI001EBCCD34|nr:DUF3017 domain-containing protein [Tessaracoccus sp.]MBK7821697.1 DUF3017 domain-containing protein [Tessaracoccus sp.]
MAAKPDKPVDWYPDSPWALSAALACVAVGTVFAVLGHWRRAAVMIAGGLLVAGVLRLVLSREAAGLLSVRSRWIDVTVLLGLGASVAVMAFLVPPAR